jgi:hypothetical protein
MGGGLEMVVPSEQVEEFRDREEVAGDLALVVQYHWFAVPLFRNYF